MDRILARFAEVDITFDVTLAFHFHHAHVRRWLAHCEGVKIPTTKISTLEERQLFIENVNNFRTASRGNANQHGSIDFDAFAAWW